jgi:rare lipoprotein A
MNRLILLFVFLFSVNLRAEDGMASFYGRENQKSALGKKLNHRIPEAAHKSLPLGSHVKVTSLKTRKSVVVKIVDRGPYMKRRVIDLKKCAANQIGLDKLGVILVHVEKL